MGVGMKLEKISIAVLVLISFLACVIIAVAAVYFSNKGFELSDETFYLYNTNHFDTSIFISQNFGILNKLTCIGEATLINLRLTKFVYQSLAVVIFVYSLLRYFRLKQISITFYQKCFLFLIALLTSYINYDYLPMTMSYNSWSMILTLLSCSLFLVELTSVQKKEQLLSAFFVGFISFCFFLAKFPNLFIVLFGYVIINLFFIKKHIFIKIIAFIIGCLLGSLVFLQSLDDLYNIIYNYRAAIFDVKHTSFNPYSSQFYNFFILCLTNYFIPIQLLVIGSAFVIKKYFYAKRNSLSIVLIVIHFAMLLKYFKGNGSTLYNDFLAGSILLTNTLAYAYIHFDKENTTKHNYFEYLFITLYLLALPFGLMFGTNNDFYYTTSQFMVFEALACFAIIVIITQNKIWYLGISTVIVAFFVLSVLYFGAIKTPYRELDLTKKTELLHYTNELKGIYESKETAIDFYSLEKIITHFNPSNKSVCLFFNHYGLTYVAGIKNLFPSSMLSDGEQLLSIDEYILNRFEFSDKAELIILPETVYHKELFEKMFVKHNVFFDKNYFLAFKYQLQSTQENIYIYKHI